MNMRNKRQVVIFDKDGTLLDSAPGVLNAVRYAIARLGLSFPPIDERRLIGPPLKYSYHHLLGVPLEDIERAITLHREYYGARGIYEAAPYPGVPELLRSLQAAGVQVCLATSKYRLLAEKMLEHFDLKDFFHYAVMSDGTELASTKTQMLAQVLDYCDCRPEHAVMVGDTAYDAEAAYDNHMPFIGVLFGYGTKGDMEGACAGARFAADVPALKAMLL